MTGRALQDLLAVQDLDSAGDQLRHRRAHLPEQAELEAIDAGSATARSDLAAVEAALTDLEGRQKATEAELATTEARAATIDRRLFGGEVSASRDLQAMSAELAQLKSRASALEDAVLGLLEEREPLDVRVTELHARLEELAGRRSETEGRLRAAQAGADAELDDLAHRRADAAAGVPAGVLDRYEQLRTRLGGVGAARLVGNRCGGCHLTLPAVELDRVRHLGDDEVYQCEQCSRILVP